jgi:transposase InsO family protein
MHVNLYGPVQDPEGAKWYVCVMTDAFTKIVCLRVLLDKMAKTIATCIWEDWIFLIGMPAQIYMDQRLEFCNTVLRQLCDDMEINHFITMPYHPQSNVQAEVFNKFSGLCHFEHMMVEDCHC